MILHITFLMDQISHRVLTGSIEASNSMLYRRKTQIYINKHNIVSNFIEFQQSAISSDIDVNLLIHLNICNFVSPIYSILA